MLKGLKSSDRVFTEYVQGFGFDLSITKKTRAILKKFPIEKAFGNKILTQYWSEPTELKIYESILLQIFK